DRLGFPVYAMNWVDTKSGALTEGFRELGFLPQAFVNMLALLGWNDGTDRELFALEELVAKFSVERISKSGAKFDYEKAKWFNHEWIKGMDNDLLLPQIKELMQAHDVSTTDTALLNTVLTTVKERMVFVSDFWQQASFFFVRPGEYDMEAVKAKWSSQKTAFFQDIVDLFADQTEWS